MSCVELNFLSSQERKKTGKKRKGDRSKEERKQGTKRTTVSYEMEIGRQRYTHLPGKVRVAITRNPLETPLPSVRNLMVIYCCVPVKLGVLAPQNFVAETFDMRMMLES